MYTTVLPHMVKKNAMTGTLLIMAGLLIVSVAGLLMPEIIYPTEKLKFSFLTNDVIDLVIGLPALALALWLVRKDHILGYLFWPGALLFVFYNFVVYSASMPFNLWYLLYPALALGSLALAVLIVLRMDGSALKGEVEGKVFERWNGGVLLVLGALYFLMAAMNLIVGLQEGSLGGPEIGLNIADISISIPWVLSGISLWRHGEFGYKIGMGWLFQANALFAGLILLMFVRPMLQGGDLLVVDIVVLAVMWLIILLPFGFAVRKVLKREA